MKSKRKSQPNEQTKLSRVQFEDAFQKFVENGLCSIQVTNIKPFLETLALSQADTNALLDHLLATMKKKEDEESITLEEMTVLLEEKFCADGEHYNKVTFTFELFDTAGKGFIDAADLNRISRELGQDITGKELKDMLNRVASNPRRDRVYKNEFKELMEKLSLF